MARHEVVIHENTSATHDVAPYTGSYISKETVALTEFAAAVGAKCGLPAIQVIAIIGGAFDAIAALEREALVRVHADLGVVCGVITGSFPTADAAFDPGRNALELALRLDDALRLDLADTVPTIITDANLTKLRVDNVMDLEVERPMNLIHGRHVFRVAGFNMVLSDEGAAAYLQNALGTTFPLIIDHVTSHQLFTAHTAELLEAGDYKLVVKSRAGDAAGPLQTSFRKVKYLRVEDPPGLTLTGVHSPGSGELTLRIDSGIWFEGTGLDAWDAATDRIEAKNDSLEEPEYRELTESGAGEAAFADGVLKLDEGAWEVLGPDLEVTEGSQVHFRVTIGGRSAEIVATVAAS
jgi:hypothetical protein